MFKHLTVILVFLMTLSSPVTARDFTVAELKPLAEEGSELAQAELGNMYATGRGVPQDYKDAVKWYRLASEQGRATAQNNLGSMYEYGHGVLQDNTLAHMWYNIASANGNENAGGYRDERRVL